MVRRLLAVLFPLVLLISIYAYLYKNKKEDSEKTGTHIVVYTYSSFASSWGPADLLKKMFKEKTGHTVEFIDAGEAGIIIQRLLLEKGKTKADVVLGLDQFQLVNPDVQSLFHTLPRLDLNLDEVVPSEKIQISPFLAFNWSPMTLIYRNSDQQTPPKKLADLASTELKGKLILLDPRSSSPGYIFFHWAVQKIGKNNVLDFFNKIKKNIYNVTPSWSAGYGLFKKKQAQYIFSYLTSPVYHWVEEKNLDYQPIYLDEELPYHIEYAGILESSSQKVAAQQFLELLLEPEAQKIIMNKNYMLPIIAGVRKGTEFDNLKKVNLFEPVQPISREEVLKIWKSIRW